MKKGYLLPTFREYWFVLQTTELSYYKSPGEKEPCGCILLNPNTRLDTSSGGRGKGHGIVVHSMDRTFELAAVDHR